MFTVVIVFYFVCSIKELNECWMMNTPTLNIPWIFVLSLAHKVKGSVINANNNSGKDNLIFGLKKCNLKMTLSGFPLGFMIHSIYPFTLIWTHIECVPNSEKVKAYSGENLLCLTMFSIIHRIQDCQFWFDYECMPIRSSS